MTQPRDRCRFGARFNGDALGPRDRTAANTSFQPFISILRYRIHPPLAFLRNYLLRGGFRDGAAGLIVSAMNSYYVFLKFAKLWELQQTTVHHEDTKGTKPTKAP